MRRRQRRAFTLVELLVVIAIMVVAGSFLVPSLIKELGRAKKDLAKPRMSNIESAIARYYMHCKVYPATLEELVDNTSQTEGWDGPYLKASKLTDPWGRTYIYVPEGQVNPGSFDLISYGADGQEGGEGENADVYND